MAPGWQPDFSPRNPAVIEIAILARQWGVPPHQLVEAYSAESLPYYERRDLDRAAAQALTIVEEAAQRWQKYKERAKSRGEVPDDILADLKRRYREIKQHGRP